MIYQVFYVILMQIILCLKNDMLSFYQILYKYFNKFVGVEQLLLLVRCWDICKILLDMFDYMDVVLFFNEIKYVIVIDYDLVEDQVYWTDDEVRVIKRVYLDGIGERVWKY